MPQDCGFSRILVRDGAKNEGKSLFFEYLATPKKPNSYLKKKYISDKFRDLRIRTNGIDAKYALKASSQLD